jgi:hypothetical protein
MTTQQMMNHEPADENPTAMVRRTDEWCFGPPNHFSEKVAAWFKRHEPTVDRWLKEMEKAGDPWWQSAEHAAYCLVASREWDLTWDGFSVPIFLFRDQWEGGTVAIFGSVEKFFGQTVEALQRFVADGLVEASVGERWLAEMRDAREDFLRCYDPATPESESMAIARRYLDPSRRRGGLCRV